MKRVLLGATLTAMTLATAAFAGGQDHMAMPVQNNNNHFFLGGALGMGVLNAKQNFTNNLTINSVVVNNASSNQPGPASFLGGLLLGYNAYVGDDFYVGVVGNALYNSLNSNISRVALSTPGPITLNNTLRNSFQGGADLRLGMKVDSVTPYILGGVEAGSWKYATNFATTTKTLVGPKVGVGVLFDVASNWNAGLEYAYTWFGTINANNAGQIVSGTVSAGSSTNSVKVNQSQVLASLNYLF